jgi:hypothetical protein
VTVHPRTDELVESIRWSFEAFVMPDLDDEYAISVAHTIRNLLSHVALRIRLEGPALDEHRRELRALLARIRDHAASSDVEPLQGLPAELDEALRADGPDDRPVPGVIDLGEKVVALRWALDRALHALQAARGELGEDEEYVAVRQAIRECLARHLLRENEWMEPAFSGRRR